MDEQQQQLYTVEDYRAYTRYIKASQRHSGYCRRVRAYIRMNRQYLHSTGWLDWAVQESNRPYSHDEKLPAWSDEQVAAMKADFESRQRSK